MIDLHAHLLPAVDDGARTLDDAAAALGRLAADGVTRLACTPHLRASEAAAAPAERHAALRAELQARAPSTVALLAGFEIMLDRFGCDLSSPALRLGGAPVVLVEFSRAGVPPRAAHELGRIRESGVVPLVAHPERYFGCSAAHVREWRAAGAATQADATLLIGTGERAALARALLAEGLVDLIASDNHGDARSMRPARDWLVEVGAAGQAELLTERNARHLLAGEPLEPVAPVVVAPPMQHRLRDLLLGRA